jgi:DNA-cytosine methyltransferase
MNVLSLFDGMSCGQIALNKLGIKYKNYLASEIDKYAISVTQENFPKTIQLGDIKKIDFKSLPKIDLLMGGSPCQGFSIAGKDLNFNDPRSALFFEYVRALRELKPKYFLLENVRMKKEYQEIISEYMGVEPVMINSSLLSAQNRVRLYWANLPISQPKDRKIYLKDVLENGLVDRDKSYCINANHFKGTNVEQYLLKKRKQVVFEKTDKPLKLGGIHGKTGKVSQGGRVYHESGKSVTLMGLSGGWGAKTGLYHDDYCIRKLTVLECKRLQTVPDDYKMNVSNTQAYKMLGNGWTVDVIAHILKGIKNL